MLQKLGFFQPTPEVQYIPCHAHWRESWHGSTITHCGYCSALIVKCPLVFQPSQKQTLSLNILFKFLILYFYFQFLAHCPDTVQRRRLTGGQMRVRGKPSLLWHAPSSHTLGKQQLVILAVILQPSCPYHSAVHGARLLACGRGLTSHLLPLAMGLLGLGCPDT